MSIGISKIGFWILELESWSSLFFLQIFPTTGGAERAVCNLQESNGDRSRSLESDEEKRTAQIATQQNFSPQTKCSSRCCCCCCKLERLKCNSAIEGAREIRVKLSISDRHLFCSLLPYSARGNLNLWS